MALDFSALSNYTNEVGAPMVNKMIAEGQTFKYVTIQPGIKTAQKINLNSTNLTVVAGSCGWSSAGSATTTQATLTVTSLQTQIDMCRKDAEAKSLQYLLKPGTGANAGDDTVQFVMNWVDEASQELRLYNENYFWTNATYGILKYLSTNSGSSVNITTGTTAITTSNIIDFVNRMKVAAPTAIKNKKPIIYMGTDAFDKFIIALTAANLFHIDPTGTANAAEYTYNYLGLFIVGTTGLDGTDQMLLTVKENLWLGTDAQDEMDKFDCWYDRNTNFAKLAAYWKIGQTILYPQLCVVKF